MKNVYMCFFLCCYVMGARGQFSGTYAPSKWTTSLSAGSNGNVNTSGAPANIIVTGSNDPSNPLTTTGMTTDFKIAVPSSGTWSFNWNYHTNDIDKDPQYDLAGVIINGTFTQLTSNTLNQVDQNGSYSTNVTAGTIIGFRINAVDNSYGNATFSISNFSGPYAVLPLQLLSFTAKAEAETVHLHWRTTNEINTDLFIIERSANGIEFDQVISEKAKGNSTALNDYQVVDNNPDNGINYYRMKAIDKNGQFSLSETRLVKLYKNSTIKAYPNPAIDQLTICFDKKGAELLYLGLYNISGSLLETKTIKSNGLITLEWNTGNLQSGIYFISSADKSIHHYFIKQ